MQPDRCVVAGGIGDHVHRLTIGIMADQDWRKRMQDIRFLFFKSSKRKKILAHFSNSINWFVSLCGTDSFRAVRPCLAADSLPSLPQTQLSTKTALAHAGDVGSAISRGSPAGDSSTPK